MFVEIFRIDLGGETRSFSFTLSQGAHGFGALLGRWHGERSATLRDFFQVGDFGSNSSFESRFIDRGCCPNPGDGRFWQAINQRGESPLQGEIDRTFRHANGDRSFFFLLGFDCGQGFRRNRGSSGFFDLRKRLFWFGFSRFDLGFSRGFDGFGFGRFLGRTGFFRTRPLS